MQIQIKKQHQEKIALGLTKQKKYFEALDRYKLYLNNYPHKLASILVDLYKECYYNPEDLNIKVIIVELYIKFGYVNDALIECEDIIENNPNFAQVYFLLSKLYKGKKETETIKNLFETAFKKGVRDSIIIDLLPKIYLDNYKIYDCIKFFEQLLSENPSQSHHTKALAELYKKIGKHKKCVSLYNTLIDNDPLYLTDGITTCENILITYPDYTFARFALIKFYIKNYNIDKVLDHLETIMKSKSPPFDYITSLFKQLNDTFPQESAITENECNFLLQTNQITNLVIKLTNICTTTVLTKEKINHYISCINQTHSNHLGFKLFTINWDIINQETNTAIKKINLLVHKDQAENVLHECKVYCLSIWKKQPKEHLSNVAYLIAQILFFQEKYHDALTYCNQAGNDFLPAIILKLSIMIKQNQLNSLKEIIMPYLKKHTQSTQLNELAYSIYLKVIEDQKNQCSFSQVEKSIAELADNNINNAIETLQQVTADKPEFNIAQLLLIRSFMTNQKFKLASNIGSQIASSFKAQSKENYVNCIFLLAISAYHNGQFSKCSDYLSEIQQINIGFAPAKTLHTHLINTPFTDHYGSALTALIDVHQSTLILTSIQNSLELSSSSTPQTISFGLNHNNQACSYMLKQNIKSAQAEINIACQLDQSLLTASCNQILIYLMNNSIEEAEEKCFELKERAKHFDLFHLTEGLLFYKKGYLKQAIESFQHVQKLNPNNLHAQYNIAMIYFLDNNIKLCNKYLSNLNQYGLFFIPLHNHIRYLEKNIFNIEDWLRPKDNYEFETIFC